MHPARWILAAALALPLAFAPAARAEFFAGLYAGGAFTQDGDVSVRTDTLGVVGTADYKGSFTADGRVGYWFGQDAPVGLALDASYFRPSEELHGARLAAPVRPAPPAPGWMAA